MTSELVAIQKVGVYIPIEDDDKAVRVLQLENEPSRVGGDEMKHVAK
jgi:hypothetical protein